MRLPLLIAAASILSCLTATAQVFEPGLLVTTAGDTVRGEIENAFWEANPSSVRFRPTADAAITSYSPAQLRSFQLATGRYFRTETLPIDRSAETRTQFLQRFVASTQQPETVFAEVLVDGPAPLLRYVIPGIVHFFVRRENQGYLELTERKYIDQDKQGRRVIVDGNRYRIQLQQYFGDCPAAVQQVAKAQYTPADLAAVVQAYNQSCSSTGQAGKSFVATAKPARGMTVNAGLLAGAQIQTMRLDAYSSSIEYGSSTEYAEAPSFDGVDIARGIRPVGGIYADVLMPKRKLALHADLSLSTLGQSGSLAARGNVPAAEYKWKGTITSIRVGVRYFVPLGVRQQLFLGSGLGFDRFNVTESSLRYGTGQPRQFAGATLPQTGTMPGITVNKNTGFSLPYLETGFRRGRFTVSADARLMGGGTYEDLMTVGHIHYDNQNRVSYLEPNQYSTIYWIFNGLVAYRLTKNQDVAPAAAGSAGR
ncbi:hypothetical protein [Hymenobacter cellulosivorans]|uniref:PorT family protein n=1 Tax=Hymenobacter cellulosivorans TaxID=2932249 RepID=A0ABY4F3P4_9BACT|nr:hypothetical protein [Hymenobacter cellulosivorans]UOQ50900.1 hypothetical protein MUN80_14150 [Hymenobacter cellulosivorans]